MRSRTKGSPIIPSEWFGLLPGQCLAFWVKVWALTKQRGVRKKDWAGVKKIAMELHKKGV